MEPIFLVILSFVFLVGYSVGSKPSIKLKGNQGEAKVRQSLVDYCTDNTAHVLNNVTLRLSDDSTTQIDHILISKKGVFVIETKNYTGWIFGNPKFKRWTQVIYRKKYSFQNPLFQNYRHVKSVQGVLGFLNPRHIHNIVVFAGDSTFKTKKIDNVCSLKKFISKINSYTEDVLTLNQVHLSIGRLESMRLELTRQTDVEHQAYLAQKFGR